jgi:hypothetical protein
MKEVSMERGKNLSDLTEEQVKQWLILTKKEINKGGVRKNGPVITISRELGSGGYKIAQIIKNKLGEPWKIWDREILDEIHKLASVKKDIIESLDEKSKSRFENFLEGILSGESGFFGIDEYKKYLVQVLLRIGHFGNAIILGRGANHVLPNSFRLRMVASRKKRVEVLKEKEGFSEEEILYLIRESDHEREDFIKKYFNANINDPWDYDLCIKSSYISPEKAAEIIISCAKDKLKF